MASNFQRKKTDYLWIFAFYVIIYWIGDRWQPKRTSVAEREVLREAMDVFYLRRFAPTFYQPLYVHGAFFFVTGAAMCFIVSGMWFLIRRFDPNIPTKHVPDQLKTIVFNLLVVLPSYQCGLNYLMAEVGLSKVTPRRLSFPEILLDILAWMLVFELTWYVQHRAMHDNYYLWKYGHEYHHKWRKPEHMVGITNFAFDAVVEGWVTMSSSFAPIFFFPINYRVSVAIGLVYMVLAVLVHWDNFPLKYHLNHHYAVVKNYGSHVLLFDWLFGTYKGPFISTISAGDVLKMKSK